MKSSQYGAKLLADVSTGNNPDAAEIHSAAFFSSVFELFVKFIDAIPYTKIHDNPHQ